MCAAPPSEAGLVVGLSSTVDCNVQGLTQSAYGLLSAPGSPVLVLLTAFLTLYVAFIGYRLILGRGPLGVSDFALSAVKIGLVLALATNWATYQAVVYQTLFHGPEQLTAMLSGAGRGGASVLAARPLEGLQIAYDEMGRSAGAYATRAGAAAQAGSGGSTLQGGPGFAAFGLNTAAFLMLASTLGLILVAKVALALLLALAPLVVGLLLFDATRGLVEGWMKAIIAFALTPLLCNFVLMAQLAAIEPFLLQLIDLRSRAKFDLAPANAVFLLTLVFAGVVMAGMAALAIIAAGLRLPRRRAGAVRPSAIAAEGVRSGAVPETSRAAVIAQAAAALERRETRTDRSHTDRRINAGTPERGPAPTHGGAATPLGQTYRRAGQPRRSAVGARRDR